MAFEVFLASSRPRPTRGRRLGLLLAVLAHAGALALPAAVPAGPEDPAAPEDTAPPEHPVPGTDPPPPAPTPPAPPPARKAQLDTPYIPAETARGLRIYESFPALPPPLVKRGALY